MPKTKRPASPLRNVFGSNLRTVRKEKGLSVFDVAYAIKMDWSYISQIERGTRNVGLDVMDALAGAVGTSLVDLLRPGEAGTAAVETEQSNEADQ